MRILSTPASDVHERLKRNSTAIKIARETATRTINKRNHVTEIAQSFGSTAEFITKYFSERFLSIHGRENISKGFLKFCKLS